MGGSRLVKRSAGTLYVRVARVDWPMVKLGRKREFRTTPRRAAILPPEGFPTPMVLWCPVGYGPVPEQQLVVCERAWTEKLGEINEESLAREGFASRKQFIDYWRKQRAGGSKGFKPLTTVAVYRVRPWEEDDLELCGAVLVQRLYGTHLEAE